MPYRKWTLSFYMKYTILINQYAAVVSGLDLDLIDLAIFDFIKDFANSSNCTKIQTPEGNFFWISHKLIMEAMPLLKIKTNQGVIKRIDNLINAGVLQKHPNCEKYKQSLYRFGNNYELLTFAPSTKVDNPKQEFRTTLNESLGTTINESLGYNNNNNDKTIIDNKEKAKNEFSQLFPDQAEQTPVKLRGTTEQKKCLFENSRFYDYDKFKECFNKPEFENVDIAYYYQAVADWSASKGRMQKDWIAQTRNFIRGDIERGKLKTLQKPSTIDMKAAMDFLNDRY